MTIGERINALCEEKDIKQKELAEAIGVTEATMSRYINDKRTPKGESAAKMATILGVTTEYLLGITDIKNHNEVNQDISEKSFSPEAQTIAAHLDEKAKNITPHKMKMLKRYIDDLFDEFDDE